MISHVRQNTFHVPHPEPSKNSSWIEQLSAVVSESEKIPATISMGQTVQHTFPFADKVAQSMALRRHDDDAQQAAVADGAVAFVNLVRHIHLRYCEQRGIKLVLGRDGPEELSALHHRE